MKEFGIDEIVDEVCEELGLTGKRSIYRKLMRDHMAFIVKVMQSKRNRISMRKCDIHTIYTNPDVHELCGIMADVDETRVARFPNGVALPSRKFKFTREQKKGSWVSHKKTEKLPRLNG